jgi:hypothetical protein
METITVGGVDREVGTINIMLDTQAIAYVSRRAIAEFLSETHEVCGRNEQFLEHISCIQDVGSKVKFIFADPDITPEKARGIVVALLTEAATLHLEREHNRSRRSHPSQGLVMDGPDRHPKTKAKSPWYNVPPRRGRRQF